MPAVGRNFLFADNAESSHQIAQQLSARSLECRFNIPTHLRRSPRQVACRKAVAGMGRWPTEVRQSTATHPRWRNRVCPAASVFQLLARVTAIWSRTNVVQQRGCSGFSRRTG